MRSAAIWGVASITLTLLLAGALGSTSMAQSDAPPRTSMPPASVQTAPEPATPAQPASDASQPVSPDQASPDQQPTAQPGSGNDQGMFVFKKQVEEVVLHATVVDQDQHLVTGLPKSAFSISQNGVPQAITSFRREDVPVEIGIVIDNSGSMRDKRGQVSQAVVNLIRASNSEDQVFVVNFGQNPYLDQDFTSDVHLLQAALHQVSAKGTRLSKKVLLVITDGQDNMSRETLRDASRRLQQANGPTLYAIGLLGSGLRSEGRDALQQLASSTGGVAYFPDSLDQVDNITRTVARDIRSQYVLAFSPHNQKVQPQYRSVRVDASAPGYGTLTVRTRSGYYPPEQNR
jgi:Ca-activated chloride channel homolog